MTVLLQPSAARSADDNGPWSLLSASQWQVAAGPGVLVGPRYPGAATVRVLPIPAIEARNGAVFFNGRDGLGADIVKSGGFRAGGALFVRFGRKLSDDPVRLAGLADIDPAPQARLFASQSWNRFQVHAVAAHDLGGGNGTTLDLDASASTRIGQVTLTAGPQAAFGDERFMRGYFSVPPGGARPAYSAGAALYQVGLSTGVFLRPAERWTLAATASVNWLQGAAARSPVVGARTQIGGGLFLAYAFGTDPSRGASRSRR